jgi:Rieske Fe-S protein
MQKRQPTEGKKLSRRTVLKAAAITGGAVALPLLMSACGNVSSMGVGVAGPGGSITVDLSRPENQSLAVVGGTLALDGNALDQSGILLVRAGQAEVTALSRTCPHQGCPVSEFQQGQSVCPCHGSAFDMSGQVLAGPASLPLRKFNATLNGTEIVIANAG